MGFGFGMLGGWDVKKKRLVFLEILVWADEKRMWTIVRKKGRRMSKLDFFIKKDDGWKGKKKSTYLRSAIR